MLANLVFRLFITARAVWAPTAFGVVGAVFDDSGRVLLVKHRYNPGWKLPGGGVDRGEAPERALLRELLEEVGMTGGTAQFFGLYTRKAGWATNVVALYRVMGGEVHFRPNLEISDICFAPLTEPPPGTTPATLRRLEELAGVKPVSSFW